MSRPRPSDDDRDVLILGPNPTPNGGMHLGHIAGPYLAGDVYARYQRARGRNVIFTTGTDDSQTYMVSSAARRYMMPADLARESTPKIAAELTAIGISIDGFGPFDDTYRETVLDFFRTLHAKGAFKLKRVTFPYRERTGEFCVEGLVEGYCPTCLTLSRGGLCETCCHPNNYEELINPHSTISADDPTDGLSTREVDILVFPLEEYRDRLTAFHEAGAPGWRPHMVQMVREVLANPLPDIPITYPLDWGMRAPFPETPGQVLNAWLELMPAGMYTTSYAAAKLGRQTKPGELWQATENLRMVHFLGFDNAFFFCIPHIALVMAHGDGKYTLPESIINNEFYEFESDKFSTSKGHVLAPTEILTEVPRDLVRLYLALTAPEFQRTTFSRVGLDKITEGRLVEPYNWLASELAKTMANSDYGSKALPVSPGARARIATMLERFDVMYEMPTFSLNRAAETILTQIDRLYRQANAMEGWVVSRDPAGWGDLFLETKALLAAAAPILIDLSTAAREVGGFDGVLTASAFADITEVTPWAPPLIPTDVPAPGADGR